MCCFYVLPVVGMLVLTMVLTMEVVSIGVQGIAIYDDPCSNMCISMQSYSYSFIVVCVDNNTGYNNTQ